VEKRRAGDFAENLTTERIVLTDLPMGTKVSIGNVVLLDVT
jgi:MOSC domain-containing protein YiiM